MMKNNYDNVILKPQREGGGNNIYGEDIKFEMFHGFFFVINLLLTCFLTRKIAESLKDESDLESYILMERIKPVEHHNYLIRNLRGIDKLNCVTELGIFGITIRFGSKFNNSFYSKNTILIEFFFS